MRRFGGVLLRPRRSRWHRPAGPPTRARGPAAIVSLGDSFISGEGGRWLGNGSAPLGTRSGTDRAAVDCDRAAVASTSRPGSTAPARATAAIAPTWRRSSSAPVAGRARQPGLLGGEGARPLAGRMGRQRPLRRAARRPIAWRWWRGRDDVELVVVTVGANDVGFGGLVAGCALDWARSSAQRPCSCRGGAQRRSRQRCRRRGAASGARWRGCGRRWRRPATPPATTAWWRWDTPPRSRSGAGSAIPRPVGAASPRAAARSGTRTPPGRPAGHGLDRGGDARGGGGDRRRVPRPRATRSTATSSATAAPAGSAPSGPRPPAPSGSGGSPSCRAPRGNRCTPTPTGSGRSAPASASSTPVRAGITPAATLPGRGYVGEMRLEALR